MLGLRHIILLCFSIFSTSLYAQFHSSFQSITINEGLSDNQAIDIIQDKEGFIWIGTMSGLNRFDGKELINVIANEKHVKTYNNRINKILEDNFGNLWLDIFDGSHLVYNKKKHTLKNLSSELGIDYPSLNNHLIFVDEKIAVLIYKNFGVFLLDMEHGQNLLGKYLFDSEILDKDFRISSVFAKNRNNIYLNSNYGLLNLKINPKNNEGKFEYLIANKSKNNIDVKHLIRGDYSYLSSEEYGLIKYNLQTNEHSTFNEIEGINLSDITSIKNCNDFIILTTLSEGIVVVNEFGQLVTQKNTFQNKSFGEVSNIYVEKNKFAWFESQNHEGLFKLDLSIQELQFYPLSFKHDGLTKQNFISSFESDSYGNIWIGTKKQGLVYFDYKTNQISQIKNIHNNSKSLVANGILSIFEDKNANIWIGTQYGISKTNIRPKPIQNITPEEEIEHPLTNKFDAIYNDSYGNKWFGSTLGQIYVYDKDKNFKFSFKNKLKADFSEVLITSFLEDSKGRMWIGTKGNGLYMLNLKKYRDNLSQANMIHLFNNSSKYFFDCNEIYDMVEDRNGRIWLASYGNGLFLLEENSDELNFLDYNKYLKNHLPFSINFGRCLLVDNENNIWFGGLNGLCSFRVNKNDLLPKNVVAYYKNIHNPNSLNYNDIGCLFQDKSNRVWIGTNGGGLYLYQQKSNNFINYSINDGLSNNMVCSIIEDDNASLWISTKNGLTKFNYNSDKFNNFTYEDGLPSNEFTESKSFNDNGILYFGTTKGIVYLNPKNLKKDSNSVPNILLTALHVSNQLKEVDQKGILTEDINSIEKINLKYNENNFSITFSTDDYQLNTSKNIEYKLEGFDKNWLNNTNNLVTYTNIPSGNYDLNIRLKDIEGSVKKLKINIAPSIWRSSLAYFFYVVFLISISYLIFTIIRKIVRLQNSLKLEKSITDFKLKFFTNISHELRTPLTLIINPIREIINGKILENTRGEKLINIAHQNSYNLLKLVNEILDFRKLQTKNIQLEVTKTDIIKFFNKITNNFNYVSQQKDIKFSTNIKNAKVNYWFDQEKLEKVVTNLLTNAFKFTPPNGYITVDLNADFSSIMITVKDSGKGFNFEQNDKIFNRFYKEEDLTRSFFAKGYGIGLSIVQEFVSLHKGEIKVDSKLGQGTTITVIIPGKKQAYREFETSNKSSWEVGVLSSQLQNINTILIPDILDKEFENNILLVEDNHELLALLSQKLMDYYNIKTARNGVEALESLKNFTPDIIITDLLMPEMNGSELTKKLKNSFETSHIPIIMLTAKAASEDKIEGYDVGADAYLTKPFEYELLISRINNLLKQRIVLKQKFSEDLNFESRTFAKNKEDQELIESIHDFIIQKLSEPNFILQDLYDYLGISKTVCYNKIKGITDMSPNQFVRTIKFKQAAKLFKTTNLNVAQVAYEIGFSDVNYFSKEFKKQFNKTPSQFIKEFE